MPTEQPWSENQAGGLGLGLIMGGGSGSGPPPTSNVRVTTESGPPIRVTTDGSTRVTVNG